MCKLYIMSVVLYLYSLLVLFNYYNIYIICIYILYYIYINCFTYIYIVFSFFNCYNIYIICIYVYYIYILYQLYYIYIYTSHVESQHFHQDTSVKKDLKASLPSSWTWERFEVVQAVGTQGPPGWLAG